MSNKYTQIYNELMSRFSTDGEVEESTRRIVSQVVIAELNKLSLKRPHKIKEEIKDIISKEAKNLS
ncbi:hypothetical protein FNH22_26595 [Fulvivirga sp. M361]|uniref:hypothetical protein n=1 Tax=Fulvivirga sp. M361 TaxID=2594266 RepID=UPI00117A3708|nr:hypothetical protein [Fulvivirga sp. M361]TRX49642.1 hypothetical protein FNH22_26595 [Fulvivirga sp. M361]